MSANGEDQRLCRAALDGLKAYGRTEFTLRFLRDNVLDEGQPAPKTRQQMWDRIEKWMGHLQSRCQTLWEYVDTLRMWGRQRIFLYEVDREYLDKLRSPLFVKRQVRGRYGAPFFQWEAKEPFLANAVHAQAPGTEDEALVLKLIENRIYDLYEGDERQTFEERSTNFFVVNLDKGYAELRVQELPTGAARDIREERDRLAGLVSEYLDFDKFHPIDLTPVMDVLLRVPIHKITGSRLKFTETEDEQETPTLLAFINQLFRRPIPMVLSAFRKCVQDVLGESELHFEMSGASDYVGFGGICDQARVNEILAELVDIARRPDHYLKQPEGGGGFVGKALSALEDNPKAQAAVLSAGAIAAAIFWIVADALGGYFFEETVQRVFGIPFFVIPLALEILGLGWYYGWRRIGRGLVRLFRQPFWEILKALWQARKRIKAPLGAI